MIKDRPEEPISPTLMSFFICIFLFYFGLQSVEVGIFCKLCLAIIDFVLSQNKCNFFTKLNLILIRSCSTHKSTHLPVVMNFQWAKQITFTLLTGYHSWHRGFSGFTWHELSSRFCTLLFPYQVKVNYHQTEHN